MTKKEAYQHLYNQAGIDNGLFSVRISDRKGRCRAYSGSASNKIDRTEFLKQVGLFRNIVNSIEDTEKIDIEIPNFLPRPQPIVTGQYPIKTAKSGIVIYHAGCTYWTSYHKEYWITKGIQLKQYSNMIDMKFANSISMIKEQKIKDEPSTILLTNDGNFDAVINPIIETESSIIETVTDESIISNQNKLLVGGAVVLVTAGLLLSRKKP